MQCFHIHVDAKNNQFIVLDELIPSKDGFHTFEYFEEKNIKTQIGIRIEHATEIVCEQFHQTVAHLTYNTEHNMWYHHPKYWQVEYNKMHTDSIFGWNAGGTFKVIAYQDDNIIEETTVIVTPGTMSLEEYIEMQEDVRHLFDLFSYDLNDEQHDSERLQNVQFRLYPLQSFSSILNKTNQLLNTIEASPEQTLTSIIVKQQPQQIKKWTAKTLIDVQKNPFKKVRTTQQIATTHILEHQMIRKMLMTYAERIRMERNYENRLIDQFNYKALQLQQTLQQVSGTVRQAVEKQWRSLQHDLTLLNQRKQQWLDFDHQLNMMLDLSYLQLEEADDIEETFLFRMHPLYNEVYAQFTQYESLQPQYEEVLQSFIRSILKSPTLYEFWILLKIIAYFSEWGLSTKDFISKVQHKLLEEQQSGEFKAPDKQLGQFKMVFPLPHSHFNIAIWYDYERTSPIGTLRPDYIIGFQNQQHPTQWTYHVLDAKYKPYHQMRNGQNLLTQDLLHSATRYVTYYQQPLQSATLIHPELHETDWNVQRDDVNPQHHVHKYGHFSFTPYHQENLNIYLRKILHERSNYENHCPSCGHTVKPERVRNPTTNKNFIKEKRTYICHVCEEVWVANYCWHCANRLHPRSWSDGQFSYPIPLYKYATYNFNTQIGDTWNVHCPFCNHTATTY